MSFLREFTAEQAREILEYDPKTGGLFWRARPISMFKSERDWKIWNARYAGAAAFTSSDNQGYLVGKIFGRRNYAHRVAWLVHKGEWPAESVDHINGRRSDNRLSNLRVVSAAENRRNQKRDSRNTSGVNGVNWHKRLRKWEARVRVGGLQKSLGYFDNIEDAAAARGAANEQYGFSRRHGAEA